MKMLGMQESWEDFSERLRVRFSKIKDEDVLYKEGYEEQTLQKIQQRLGWSRNDLMELFERMRLTK